MRHLIRKVMILLFCIMLCSMSSNATSVNEEKNVNVEAPFAAISDFYLSQKVVEKKDVLKYSFTISFVDSFDYTNRDLFGWETFRTGEYWVDVCWQSPKKQKIERTYECVEKNNALFIEDTIPIEKGMQAGDWQIMYIRISNFLQFS